MTVLILAREFDPTADAVVGDLAQRQVPVFRTDLSDFPSRLRLDAQLRDGRWSGWLWNDYREVELGGVRSIWNRNPSTYVFPASMPTAEQDFAYRLKPSWVLVGCWPRWTCCGRIIRIGARTRSLSPTSGKWPLSAVCSWPIR